MKSDSLPSHFNRHEASKDVRWSRYGLKHLLYAFALLGASMGLFGLPGIFVAVVIMSIWHGLMQEVRTNAEKSRLVALANRDSPQVDVAKPRASQGFTASELVIVLCIVGMLVGLLMPVVLCGTATTASHHCHQQMRHLSIAFHNYHDVHGCFPPPIVYDKQGQAMHSWRTLLLPYVEHSSLFRKYNFGEPWDGPNNSALMHTTPFAYRRGWENQPETRFEVVVGPQAVWPDDESAVSLDKVPRPATSLMFIATNRSVPWMKPTSMTVEEAQQLLTSKPDDDDPNWEHGFFTSQWMGRSVMTAGDNRFQIGRKGEGLRTLLNAQGQSPPEDPGDANIRTEQLCLPYRVVHYHNIARTLVFVVIALWPAVWVRQTALALRNELETELGN